MHVTFETMKTHTRYMFHITQRKIKTVGMCTGGGGGVLGVLNTGLGKPQEPSPAAFSARLGTQFQPERTKRDRFCSVFLSFLFFPPKISKI